MYAVRLLVLLLAVGAMASPVPSPPLESSPGHNLAAQSDTQHGPIIHQSMIPHAESGATTGSAMSVTLMPRPLLSPPSMSTPGNDRLVFFAHLLPSNPPRRITVTRPPLTKTVFPAVVQASLKFTIRVDSPEDYHGDVYGVCQGAPGELFILTTKGMPIGRLFRVAGQPGESSTWWLATFSKKYPYPGKTILGMRASGPTGSLTIFRPIPPSVHEGWAEVVSVGTGALLTLISVLSTAPVTPVAPVALVATSS